MDTSDLMLEHIKARILRIRSCYIDQNTVSIFDKERLDELNLMLEVLRNANNLARLAQEAKPKDRMERLIEMDERLEANEPTITFRGNPPR